jgi:hypothetical protein
LGYERTRGDFFARRRRSKKAPKPFAFHFGARLKHGLVVEKTRKLFKGLPAQNQVLEFSSAIKDRNFGLVALFEELQGGLGFVFEVVDIGFGAQLHLFHLNVNLFLFSNLGFLLFLVLELAVVHDLTDRWIRARGNHHEVESESFGEVPRLASVEDAELFAVFADHTNIRSSDLAIDEVGIPGVGSAVAVSIEAASAAATAAAGVTNNGILLLGVLFYWASLDLSNVHLF